MTTEGRGPARPSKGASAFRERGLRASLGMAGAVRLLGVGSQFVATILITRSLGAAGYGRLAFGLALTWFTVLLTGLRLSDQVARHGHGSASQFWGAGMLAGLLAGGVLAIGSRIWTQDPATQQVLIALTPFAVAGPPLGVLEGAARAADRVGLAVALMNGAGVARMLTASAIVLTVATPTPVAFAMAESAVAAALLAWGLTRLAGWRWSWRPDGTTLRAAVRASPALLAMAISAAVLARLDVAMLGFLRPLEEVAAYQIAVALGDVPLQLYSAALITFIPRVARRPNADQIAQEYRGVLTTLGGALAPVLAALAVYGDVASARVFGEALSAGSLVYLLIATGMAAQILTGPNGAVLVGRDSRRPLIVLATGLVVSDLVLNLVLIPPLGMLGAALATAVAYLIVNGAAVVYVRPHVGPDVLTLRWLGQAIVLVGVPAALLGAVRLTLGTSWAALGVAAIVTVGLSASSIANSRALTTTSR